MWELRGKRVRKKGEDFQMLSMGRWSVMVLGRLHWQCMECGSREGSNGSSFGCVEFRMLVGHPCGEIQWHMGI